MNMAVQEGIIFCEGKGVGRGRVWGGEGCGEGKVWGGEGCGEGKRRVKVEVLELWLPSVKCLARATPLPGPYVSHQETER